jgi:hypothetical protein
MVGGLLIGFGLGFGACWLYFWRTRLLRTRWEWYGDPVVRTRHGDDPNPEGWSYYGRREDSLR